MQVYDVFMTDLGRGEELYITVTAKDAKDAKQFAQRTFGCVSIDSVILVPTTPRDFRMDDASPEVREEYDAYLKMVA